MTWLDLTAMLLQGGLTKVVVGFDGTTVNATAVVLGGGLAAVLAAGQVLTP